MKQTIWKFEVDTVDNQQIELPEGSLILTIQTQAGKPCIWALVNPDSKKIKVNIEIYGTGHGIPEGNRTYIGTYQLVGGGLIFHAFQTQK